MDALLEKSRTICTPSGNEQAVPQTFLGSSAPNCGSSCSNQPAKPPNRRFGELLLKRGLIQQYDLEAALHLGRFRKKKLGRLCVELGLISGVQLDSLLIEFLKPFCTLSYNDLKPKVDSLQLNKGDRDSFSRLKVVPIDFGFDRIVVVGTHFKDQIVSAIEERFARNVDLLVAESRLLELLEVKGTKSDSAKSSISVTKSLTDDQKLSEPDPFARLLKNCFESAKMVGASDIHFEPYELEYLIRFRVHGHLNDWKRLSADHILPVTSKLKWIINMDLGIIGQPQDSRATLHSLGIDIRGSSMPVTSGGEKIVLRSNIKKRPSTSVNLGSENINLKYFSIALRKARV